MIFDESSTHMGWNEGGNMMDWDISRLSFIRVIIGLIFLCWFIILIISYQSKMNQRNYNNSQDTTHSQKIKNLPNQTPTNQKNKDFFCTTCGYLITNVETQYCPECGARIK
ncbi:hypothetical protein [Candidatus Lokiarchaeum ossiferum]|uniref:hypothetical protein n=1 Tax=Candidatus Lokiarchaeum ossiferum TaxID=2951803 RepID=UPI00352D7D37